MIRRGLVTALLALVAVLLAPAGAALAAPVVEIETPSQGSVTNDRTPTIAGVSSDSFDEVAVTVYSQGSPVASMQAQPQMFSGQWSVQTPVALEDGPYLVVAEQAEAGEPAGSDTVSFSVHASPPQVTLDAVPSPTNDSTPSFTGTASEESGVTVRVYAAGHVGGTVYAEAHAGGTGGEWSSGGATPALADGTYTAVAEQESEYGDGPGYSEQRTFVVHAAKPHITMSSVPSPSEDPTPSFSGTASEGTSVTVHVYAAGHVGGTVYAEAHASPVGSAWSGEASPALPNGTYTAVAEQESEYGNGPGHSQEVTFTVDIAAPSVTLNPIESPSNDTTPSFSGYASERTPVAVYVWAGSSAKGTVVAEAGATGTGGEWTSGSTGALKEGSYTAVAVQEGAFANGSGHSQEIHFSVITAPPKVTLNAIKSPYGNTAPSFTGSASDTTSITISIHAGSATGPIVSTAQATGTGGSFASGHVSPALPAGEYTAIATQPSSLGNPAGFSNPVGFVVDTSSPTVTLEPPAALSNDSTPTFSGTASETEPVEVKVSKGGSTVGTLKASVSGGHWSATSPKLEDGTYQAVATEPSSLGNPAGSSSERTFTINTKPPSVTLEQPAVLSNVSTPSFSGTASETEPVEVKVTKAGSTVETLKTSVSGGHWSTTSPKLEDGTYKVVASERSSLGNPTGLSPERTFTINTKAPSVTLNGPSARTRETKPSFSGTASETNPVTVKVYKGTSVGGTLAGEAQANVSGGAWAAGPLASTLAEGTYTAVAREDSSVEHNPTGESNAVTFTVETKSPTVTLQSVASPSNNRTPTFTGTATDTTPVVVHVYRQGVEVASAEGTPNGGSWSAASPALPSGDNHYTAFATQKSFVGNPEGRSPGEIVFEVNTEPPSLSIEPLTQSPSNNRSPVFSGTTSDSTRVVVHVFEGSNEVANAEATPSGGKWQTGPLSSQLPSGEHAFTAYATQASSLKGNPEGKSAEVAFTVNTNPPKVTIEPLPSPSNNDAPTFTGAASDTTPVTVVVTGGGKKYEVSGAVSGGSWTAGPLKLPAVKTTYTALAIEPSSLKNAPGESRPPIQFVVDPGAPAVVMSRVAPQIDTSTPTFTGSASETSRVKVSICRAAASTCEPEAGEWAAESAGGHTWAATLATPLPEGEYQAVASQRSVAGALGASTHQDFTVDTSPPAVELTAPGPGAAVSGSTVDFHGTAGTARHDEQFVTLQLYAGGSSTGTPLQTVAVAASGGSWSAALAGIAPGVYTARASQSDEAGNVAVSEHAFTDLPPAAAAGGPTAAFAWYPSNPHVGETVTLVSGSTDATSPITGYAWNTLGSAFTPGAQTITTSFATTGNHLVQLRITDGAGLTSTTSRQIAVSYQLMSPFPAVRIVTTRKHGKVRLTILSVQAPAGARVAVTCTGKGCPLRSQARVVPKSRASTSAATAMVFARFERPLPAGVALQIRVSMAGTIGKYTRFAIRKGKLPLRTDACLNSTEPKPVPCPR